MQKVVREKQEMMYSMGNLQRIELENHRLKHQNMDQSEQITKLHASLQEYGLLRDHIQEYYKALQDSQMELQREKEKSRHINDLLSKTGYRLDSMASELNNYRTMTDGYRRSLEEEKEKSNKLERKLDRLTIDNEKLTEERDKCEQKSFEYKDECRSLREDLEKSQAECRDLLSQTQDGASDGTTSLLQGNYFTSTPMGNGFGKPSSQSNFVFDTGSCAGDCDHLVRTTS
nr:protein Hook homolog 1-like isoform X1 [Crassostrea gigas]